jgi:hypothetical protein
MSLEITPVFAMKNADEVKDKLAKLTRRNLEVLSLVCDGYSYKEIGARLHITERAVQFHMTTVYHRLELYFEDDKYKRRAELYQVYCPVLKNLDVDEWPPVGEEVLPEEEPTDARVFALVIRDAEEGIIPMSKGEIIEGQIISIEPSPPPSLPPPPNGRRLVLSAVLGSVISTVLVLAAVAIYITWSNRQSTPSEQLQLPTVTPVVQVVVHTVERMVVATAIPTEEVPTPAVQVVVQTVEVERVVTATPEPLSPTPPPPPTGTPIPPTATHTPQPTQTPWIIIATPIPTPVPTEPENTPPGTILEVGETWKQDGLHLTLRKLEMTGGGIVNTWFVAENKAGQVLNFKFNTKDVVVTDNNGVVFGKHYEKSCTQSHRLEKGESRDIKECYNWTGFRHGGDYFDPEVTYLVVTISNFGRIGEAKWRTAEIAH